MSSAALGLALLAGVGGASWAAELGALAGQQASIPLPATAEDVKLDDGSLAFTSASSVADIVQFFRSAMKPLGWSETPSVINKPNMVVLEFEKGGKSVNLTVMQMGTTSTVEGDGDGLVAAAAPPDASQAASAPKAVEGEDNGGLPVPKDHSMSGTESTPFRHGVNAQTSIDLASILAFYRGELTKRGWSEQLGADVRADQASVAFTSPDGPAILKLSRSGEDTVVNLTVRDQSKAKQSGLLPKPGQVKAMFGNMTGADAVFTLNKKSVKVAAGAGSKGPDGPTLELPPGKYTVTVKVAGQGAHSEPVEVGPDEIWGFMAGPGGVLPVQMY